ncbi:MAG: ketoacyl-ACP synthase III [Candidatus Omnitrophica bacterium]|nr:ketoacyl-ACP synthase III [Candidatus Omnitrophota bacterium]
MKVLIEAIEYYLPSKVEGASALKRDNPDWKIEKIEEKTGIAKRHVSGVNETAVDMAVSAAEKIFLSGNYREKIDLLILVTQSPDYKLPTSACLLQDLLRLNKDCMAFDINLGCSGFIYALAVAASLIETGTAKRALVICSDTYTKYIGKKDRTCRPIFSDGAAAILLKPCNYQSLGPFDMGTDGSGFFNLVVPASGARVNKLNKPKGKLFMNGPELFMFTMDVVPKTINALLDKAGKTIKDIDLFIFHQASKVVIDNIIRRMEIPKGKVFINYRNKGNTVSASIPIALKDAQKGGRLRANDKIMLIGFGVGYSWGSCLIRWGGQK